MKALTPPATHRGDEYGWAVGIHRESWGLTEDFFNTSEIVCKNV